MVNMIDVDEIASKLKYTYDNYNIIKDNYTDVSMYDIKNIDYWL